MRIRSVVPRLAAAAASGWLVSATAQTSVGQTEIATWQDGKRGAVTLTYDDSNINQFEVALPLMNERRLPATFFVITGGVTGAENGGRFIGRSPADILRESATVPTNAANYLERLSAAPFLGFDGLIGLRTSAAPATAQTFTRVDAAYARARNGELPAMPPNASTFMDNRGDVIQSPTRTDVRHVDWDTLRRVAAQGHEIASHTVTHPRLDALDEANILYEIERSRQEILERLGPKYTFSAECPFGIEDPRAIGYALKTYQALRNRMPEPWLEELNRSSRADPLASQKPYVQWQRGAVAATTMETIHSWVDTAAGDDNMWLVFVIHGVEGIGWEALSRHTLTGMFDRIVARGDRVWVATFQDVTKYMRERMNGKATSTVEANRIRVALTHTLDPKLYDLPLTLKTYVPDDWTRVRVAQGSRTETVAAQRDARGGFVSYRAMPNGEEITLGG